MHSGGCCREVIVNIFDWVGGLVARACHNKIWVQVAQYPAAEYQHSHQNTWEPASHSVFVTATRAESYRYPEPSTINPASGLPIIGNSGIDVLGNPFGFNHSSWDRHDPFASFGHGSCGGSLPAGYDPVRGW
jgi:hypothetical protein